AGRGPFAQRQSHYPGAQGGRVRPPGAAAQFSRLAGPGPRIPAGEDPLRVVEALLEVAAVKEPLAAAVKRDVRIPPVTELGLAYGYAGVPFAELIEPHALIRVVPPGSSPCCHHAQASFQDETWTNAECTDAISRIVNHTEIGREGKPSVASRPAEANRAVLPPPALSWPVNAAHASPPNVSTGPASQSLLSRTPTPAAPWPTWLAGSGRHFGGVPVSLRCARTRGPGLTCAPQAVTASPAAFATLTAAL